LRIRSGRYRATDPDGTQSAPISYDEVERRAIDAVVMVAFYDSADQRRVFLRSAVRPPARTRRRLEVPTAEGNLWELPAGLVEPDEQSPEGLVLCAQRELHEELGFAVDTQRLAPLGPSLFPSPGLIGERHHYFVVEVDPARRGAPLLDGSALEHFGDVIDPPLGVALDWCRKGRIEDAKTELGLRRLAEHRR
jgi:ADP-ribose pyrophosphatase